MDILKEILDVTKKNSHQVFMIDASTGDRFTFNEFYHLSCKLASILSEYNVKKGTKVCIMMNNCIEYVLIYFSLLYCGTIVIPINPLAHENEIRFIVENIKPAVIIYSETTLGIYQNIKKKLPKAIFFKTKVAVDIPVSNIATISLSSIRSKKLDFQPFEGVKATDIFSITFTSGTTSSPKGVIHSIDNLFSNALAFNKFAKVNTSNRFHHILPMSYMAGFLNLIVSPFMAGSSIVVAEEFSASSILDFWSIPIRYKVDSMWLIPTILAMLVKIDRDQRARNYCSQYIKNIFVGTAPLSMKTKKEFEDKYGKTVFQSYGLSELLIVSVNLGEKNSREDSVGRVIEGVDIRIRNNEVYVKSSYKMLGYYNISQSGDHWFPTGDLGFIDPNKKLVITGRKKDLIIKGGVNISPLAIEKIIDAHPAVDFSVVVGVPDDYFGEVIAAAVKLKQGYSMKDIRESIISFCKANLGIVQQPSYFVDLEEFPQNLIGKIQRSKLKELINLKVKVRT